MWAAAPLGVAFKKSSVSDIYFTIHKSSKLTVVKDQRNNFMMGEGRPNMRYCIKGSEHHKG